MKRPWRPSTGFSLPELMVAMAIGMMLILASISLLLASRGAYLLHDDRARVEESGRYALELVSRAVRQAGYRDWSASGAGGAGWAAVSGLDAASLRDAADGIAAPHGAAVNGSDVLALRFEGSGGAGGDGAMQNCAGAAVAAGDAHGGWSIFYIANDSGGEPELRCKYRGASGWKSDALVRGVEVFQVLYGLGGGADGMPRRYVSATAMRQARASDWQAVTALRIALLARGTRPDSGGAAIHDLFGPDYDHSADPGARFSPASLPASSRTLLRRVYRATIFLRNRAPGAS